MLDLILQILSALGIIVLVLLAVLAAVLLLVLFFPVSYRVQGRKDAEVMECSARAAWLFGLLRVRYVYPEPGKVRVKLLWFPLYDGAAPGKEGKEESSRKEETSRKGGFSRKEESSRKEENSRKEEASRKERASRKKGKKGSGKTGPREERDRAGQGPLGQDASGQEQDSAKQGISGQEPMEQEAASESREKTAEAGADAGQDREDPKKGGISQKIQKIKFTIQGLYDKIKKVWENITYYTDLWNDNDTRGLLNHAKFRLFRILKSIRPRKLRADVLFGTGAPDTTGYAYGAYCMLSPFLGKKATVIPDFERAVLEGTIQASGHVTLAVLLWHGLRVITDRRLWKLLDKLKSHGGKAGKKTGGAEKAGEKDRDKGIKAS